MGLTVASRIASGLTNRGLGFDPRRGCHGRASRVSELTLAHIRGYARTGVEGKMIDSLSTVHLTLQAFITDSTVRSHAVTGVDVGP